MARKSSVNQRRLSRLLRRVEPSIGEPIKEAIADSAQVILNDARNLVPVDTGNLRDHITGKLSRSGFTASVGILGKIAKKMAYYAHFVEFGTRGYQPTSVNGKFGYRNRFGRFRKTKTLRRIPARPAKPFLTPALEMNKATAIRTISATVDKALERIARGF